jgi:glycine/D-amino acid oxidase-like deaminating enzyme
VVSHREYREAALHALPERGERFLALLREGGDLLYALARRHRIDCDAVQGGYHMVAHRPSLLRFAERKVERWTLRGFRLRLLGRAETERATGSPRFLGAALDEAGGRINPFRFTQGLAAAAARAGAAVFARSPAISIDRDGSGWVVRAPRGAVRAERVVVCTSGYTDALVPALARSFLPLSAYAIALRALPRPPDPPILPSGGVLMQLPTGFHPFLVDGTGRLVSSFLPGALRPHDPAAPLCDLRRWLARTFPQLAGKPLELDAYWPGAMAGSTDLLPRIFTAGPGLLALLCFSGEGNVLAPALGKHLAELLLRGSERESALPWLAPPRLRARWRLDLGLRRLAIPTLRLAERVGLF